MKHALAGWSLLVAMVVLLSLAGATPAENWPQWRGPGGDGVSKETNLPTEWSSTKNVAWKLKLPGMGGSTPAVWGERIFLTSGDGPDLVLLCISTEGKELWKRQLGTGDRKVQRGPEGNNASPSPSTDGKYVYAFVGTGDCACFDFDGKEIWKFNAQERYGKFRMQYGMHSTPLLHGDRLYFQLIHDGGAWVIAIDKSNGKEVWKVNRESDGVAENKHSYASPVLWSNGKDSYLISHGNDYAIAHRLDDGSEIWRVTDLNPKSKYNYTLRFVSSPVATPDLIVVPSAKNGPTVALKPDGSGKIGPGDKAEQWRYATTPDVPSPLVYEGLVYLCMAQNGRLICLDAKTGKKQYEEDLHRAIYRASPVGADGKVYLTARDGVISVVKAGAKFELLAANTLPDQITASPAISNGRIYVRGWETLYALGPASK
jgi:outer membrane protein assembly factor BamB